MQHCPHQFIVRRERRLLPNFVSLMNIFFANFCCPNLEYQLKLRNKYILVYNCWFNLDKKNLENQVRKWICLLTKETLESHFLSEYSTEQNWKKGRFSLNKSTNYFLHPISLVLFAFNTISKDIRDKGILSHIIHH